MILGWQEAHCVSRYVLIDMHVPWPALHYSRIALRRLAQVEMAARKAEEDEGRPVLGPRRMSWPVHFSLKEDGEAEMRVWPVTLTGGPRNWTPEDGRYWRERMQEWRRIIAVNLPCLVRLDWMPGGSVEVTQTVPSLAALQGFWGWGKGEHEPTIRQTRLAQRAMAQRLIDDARAGA